MAWVLPLAALLAGEMPALGRKAANMASSSGESMLVIGVAVISYWGWFRILCSFALEPDSINVLSMWSL